MVDSQSVEHFKIVRYPLFPPAKSVLLHSFPVVKRIAPKLAVGRKIVRRNPGHPCGIAVPVKEEKLPVKIKVTAVKINIKGHVAYKLYALF